VQKKEPGFGFFADSWGAKIHPVRHQEWAAEGAITILPKRSSLPGINRGCQMVYLRKNTNLGLFWRALEWKNVDICGHLYLLFY
jgi:hypothetical protein